MDFERVLREGHFAGRSPEQVDEFLAQEVRPIRERYRHLPGQRADVTV